MAAVDAAVVKLCLLRGERVLNLLPPEGFQKAGNREKEKQTPSCLSGRWCVAKTLCSGMSALLPAGSGLWARAPSLPAPWFGEGGGGRV